MESEYMYNIKSMFLILILLAIASFTPIMGQSSSASLSGTVHDVNGAVVPNASVSVADAARGLKRQTTTNGNGYFTVVLLPPSTYTVTVEQSGFAAVEVQNVVLNANDQKSLRIELKVGTVGATVDVTSGASLINDSGSVGTTIDSTLVANLPLNGRSLQTLIALSPGIVAMPVAGNGGNQGQFSVNGQRTNANYFTVDGVSGNFSVTNFEGLGQNGSGSIPTTSITGSFASLASVDSLQEITIQTSTFAAEFGRSPGGQISLVTRSGQIGYHGSIF